MSKGNNHHSVTQCANKKCLTTTTPLWRKGWMLPSGGHVKLCNACGLHFKKEHFCPYCMQIYRESEDEFHNRPNHHTMSSSGLHHHNSTWLVCHRCSRWVHRQCELRRNPNAVSDLRRFLCPNCRQVKTDKKDAGKKTTSHPATPRPEPLEFHFRTHQVPSGPNSTTFTTQVLHGFANKQNQSQSASFKSSSSSSPSSSSSSSSSSSISIHSSNVNKTLKENSKTRIELPSYDDLATKVASLGKQPSANFSKLLEIDPGLRLLPPYRYFMKNY